MGIDPLPRLIDDWGYAALRCLWKQFAIKLYNPNNFLPAKILQLAVLNL
jgi:hypothetical protein